MDETIRQEFSVVKQKFGELSEALGVVLDELESRSELRCFEVS